ncbi:hypothetical protein CMO90_04075, partial [Candidatus Woesearchaeota archaeon]|nr:hypothetical protein [Candidatus Woesearchaeota archaeon]
AQKNKAKSSTQRQHNKRIHNQNTRKRNKRMTNINIEIPDELHKKIKLKAVHKDSTIKEYIIKTLEKETKE